MYSCNWKYIWEGCKKLGVKRNLQSHVIVGHKTIFFFCTVGIRSRLGNFSKQ